MKDSKLSVTLSSLTLLVEEKISLQVFKDELDDLKNVFNGKTDGLVGDLIKRIEKAKMTLLGKQGEIDRVMKEMEKKNAWKLNEVEILLDSRASQQYVDDTLQDLENRLGTLVRTLINLTSEVESELSRFSELTPSLLK